MTPPTTTATVTARDVRAAVIYVVAVLVLFLAGISDDPLLGVLLTDGPLWPGTVSLVLMLVCAAVTAFRTARPVVLLAFVVPVALAELFLGTQTSAYLLIVEALWAPVARGSWRLARATTIVGVVVAVILGAVFLAAGVVSLPWTTAAVVAGLIIVVVVFTPLAWAWEVRHHRMAQEAAENLAVAEHALAGERAAREVEADRLRIAHDLHDVVAGHLSAVTLHTSLAAELEDEEARDRSLETARGSAEAALHDLRSVIDVLSRSGSGEEPGGSPGGGTAQTTLSWDILRRRLGEDATVEITEEVDEVPVGVRTTMLHIAAEAVTNANRHGETPRSLQVGVEDGEMIMRCVNALATIPPASSSAPTLGLRTMSNRAAMVSGTVQAGPTGEPGEELWTVSARLPVNPDTLEDGD
ncbi:MAG TPA: hypothetical protein H9870_12680 [Candidatus Corynebacterium avicola]|uniref:histidine kinase n=1 Tax=Candidatus Corynebacterium avicola TaxID=2838527 RepID=A0A9D1RRN4_9CORY|nr:hypothetical protein [Candidatus Corynebacterium avicola]